MSNATSWPIAVDAFTRLVAAKPRTELLQLGEHLLRSVAKRDVSSADAQEAARMLVSLAVMLEAASRQQAAQEDLARNLERMIRDIGR